MQTRNRLEIKEPPLNLSDPNQRRVFFELHTDLPREGPGNRDSTTRALRLMGTLPDQPLLVDIACGPGAQTLDLAQLLPDARIVATDAHKPYLDELNRRIEATGAGNRIETRLADMRALPFQPNSIDVMWCEGAAYIVGVPDALAAWAPLLKPGGRIALTEPVWLRPDPPEVVRRNWEEYPAMTDVPACRAIVARAGLKLLGDFVLPEAAWWDHYYAPLKARTQLLRKKYPDDAAAATVLQSAEGEVAAYRDYSTYFGYQFFVMAKPA
ncbi:MAG TPA: class I SAM-dependent methyltransferase [Pseudomonadales bacterium]|nr:class I SAM-dependent methyltransferase [Pseudomonadales bacterium]